MTRSIAMNRFIGMFFIGFFILLFSAKSNAICLDGRHPSVEQEFKKSRFVVKGVVEGVEYVSSPDDPEGIDAILYHVRILQAFKGNTERKITIRSENTSSRFNMTANEHYLLFLTGPENDATVDSCGNSGRIEERKKEMTQLLPLAKTLSDENVTGRDLPKRR